MKKFFGKDKKDEIKMTTDQETKIIGKPETDKEIIICDSSILIYSLEKCKNESHIYLPSISYTLIKRIAKGDFINRDDNFENSKHSLSLASDTLKYIEENLEWCTVVERMAKEELFVIPVLRVKNEVKAVAALACDISSRGFNVCVMTANKAIRDLIQLQKKDSIQVEFFEM